MSSIVDTIESARKAAGLSQRELADRIGLSQPTVQRILSGERQPKTPELLLIADAVGCTIAQLTGKSAASRVEFAARSTNDAEMNDMRARLVHFLDLDAYLDAQAIPHN